MATVSRHNFNIGPMGKLFKSQQFKANMAWMVFGGPILKLCLLKAAILDGGQGHQTQF
jgi:hypothetical protein